MKYAVCCISEKEAFNYWDDIFRSKGEAKALFLRHEGFLGALGAFVKYEKNGDADRSDQFTEQRFESSTLSDEQDNGCIECRMQVREK